MPILVPARFNGPPHSANGGYLSGRLSSYLDGSYLDGSDLGGSDLADSYLGDSGPVGPGAPIEVTLRSPPPLDVRLDVVEVSDGIDLYNGETLVAQARLAALTDDPPDFVSFPTALAAAAGYPGRLSHPFPTCFVCGLDRDDGLALQPGPVGEATVAAAWAPDNTLRDDGSPTGAVNPEFGWAALDCPGGWSIDLGGRPMVLGRMTARLLRPPSVGEACVVVGQARELVGRKAFTASALYNADAELLGFAEAVWLQVDPAQVRPAG